MINEMIVCCVLKRQYLLGEPVHNDDLSYTQIAKQLMTEPLVGAMLLRVIIVQT